MSLQSLLTLPPWRVLLSHPSSGNLPPPALLHCVSNPGAYPSWVWPSASASSRHCLSASPCLQKPQLGGLKALCILPGSPSEPQGPHRYFLPNFLRPVMTPWVGHSRPHSCWWDKWCRYQIVIELVLQPVAKCHFMRGFSLLKSSLSPFAEGFVRFWTSWSANAFLKVTGNNIENCGFVGKPDADTGMTSVLFLLTPWACCHLLCLSLFTGGEKWRSSGPPEVSVLQPQPRGVCLRQSLPLSLVVWCK